MLVSWQCSHGSASILSPAGYKRSGGASPKEASSPLCPWQDNIFHFQRCTWTAAAQHAKHVRCFLGSGSGHVRGIGGYSCGCAAQDDGGLRGLCRE